MQMTTMRRTGTTLLGFVLAGALVVGPLGCGGDFLGLEDYQRDLLVGGLAAGLLLTQDDGGGDVPAGDPIPGAEGPEGSQGVPGAEGPQGPEGPEGPAGPAGADGLEGPAGTPGLLGPDGPTGINCWDLNANGEADLDTEDVNNDGAVDVLDCRGEDGAPGSSGSGGGAGPQGPELFDILVDDFFAGPGTGTGELTIDIVPIEEPALGNVQVPEGLPGEAVGYRVAIPEVYDAGNDVTMRIFFHRTGPLPDGWFVARLLAVRLRHGFDVEPYGDMRWIRVDIPAGAEFGEGGTLLVVDLPVNTSAGLGFPSLATGDLLAFELMTYCEDGGLYHLLAVQFFESLTGTATLDGATIFTDDDFECPEGPEECPDERTYTINADFDEGVLNGVEYETAPDQLQLTTETTTFPVAWIANAGEDSLSRWDTELNVEVARYHTWFGPLGTHGAWDGAAPSRTAVDLEGNCYVANRHFDNHPAEVFKILLDGFVDRNGNSVIDTSTDANSDGTITPDEMLPMADTNGNNVIDDGEIVDERIAWVAEVGSNGALGRSLAIDGDGNIWVGLHNTREYYKISGADGSILEGPIDVNPNTPYGALVDRNGILWGASTSSNLLRLDTNNTTDVTVLDHSPYGANYGIALGRDALDNTRVYLGTYSGLTYIEYDSGTGTFSNPAALQYDVLGIATDSSGNILAGDWNTGGVTKFAPDGSVIWSAPSQGPAINRGTIVDSNDDVWLVHLEYNVLSKFAGSDGAPLGVFNTGQSPYTYSDATGLGLRTAFPTGTWTVSFDGGAPDIDWFESVILWSSDEPEGTSVTVRVRSSNDQASWSDWEDVTNGVPIVSTPPGRYLQIEVTLRINDGEVSPVLFDLTLFPGCGDGPPDGA